MLNLPINKKMCTLCTHKTLWNSETFIYLHFGKLLIKCRFLKGTQRLLSYSNIIRNLEESMRRLKINVPSKKAMGFKYLNYNKTLFATYTPQRTLDDDDDVFDECCIHE